MFVQIAARIVKSFQLHIHNSGVLLCHSWYLVASLRSLALRSQCTATVGKSGYTKQARSAIHERLDQHGMITCL